MGSRGFSADAWRMQMPKGRSLVGLLVTFIAVGFIAFYMLPTLRTTRSAPMSLLGFTNVAGDECALFELPKPTAVSRLMNFLSTEQYCELQGVDSKGTLSTNLSVFRSLDYGDGKTPQRLRIAIPKDTIAFSVKYHRTMREGRVINGSSPPKFLFTLPSKAQIFSQRKSACPKRTIKPRNRSTIRLVREA